MMDRCWATVAAVGLILPGCSSAPGKNEAAAFEVFVRDVPAESRFVLELRSNTDSRLCLARYGWPNDWGFVTSAAPARLISGDVSMTSKPWNANVCIGGCEPIIVAPHAKLVGFIAYRAFGNAEEVSKLPARVLDFPVYARKCTPDMFPTTNLPDLSKSPWER